MAYVYVLSEKDGPLMPTTRCGHVFTDVEISELLKGNPIMFTYDGRNGPATAIGKLGEGEYNGRKYWGFQKN